MGEKKSVPRKQLAVAIGGGPRYNTQESHQPTTQNIFGQKKASQLHVTPTLKHTSSQRSLKRQHRTPSNSNQMKAVSVLGGQTASKQSLNELYRTIMPQKSAAVVHAASKESLATASSKYGTSTISLAKDIGTAPGGNKRLKRGSKAVSHHTYKS